MASSSQSKDEQYQFCKICRINHTTGRKHVYSRKHKEVVEKLLERFFTRISDCLTIVEEPRVNNVENQVEKKFWCYFCEADINTHQVEENNCLEFAGMIHHLASSQHLAKARTFWRQNRLDGVIISKYYITREKLESYKNALCQTQKQFCEEKRLQLIKDAEIIKRLDAERMRLIEEESNRNVEATVFLTNGNCNEKIPPWLQDEPGTSTAAIGPSKSDFDNHVSRKRPLPPNRVGANFDHSASTSAEWLPSFGRVWNNGRRLQSKREFKRQKVVKSKRSM